MGGCVLWLVLWDCVVSFGLGLEFGLGVGLGLVLVSGYECDALFGGFGFSF